MDEQGKLDYSVIKAAFDDGLMGIEIPEKVRDRSTLVITES